MKKLLSKVSALTICTCVMVGMSTVAGATDISTHGIWCEIFDL